MKQAYILAFALLMSLLHAVEASGTPSIETAQTIAVRFHLVTDMPMTMKGVDMTHWITPEMIEKTVMPEVNRIWSSAQIKFELRGVKTATTLNENRADAIAALLKATRESEAQSSNTRSKQLNSLIDLKEEDARVVNIYVVPFLGGTFQGLALPGQKRVFVGQWTDKPSHGLKPPEKCLLVENGEFQQGSFSRTVGHELGHILGLGHPTKDTPPFHRLMGGSKPGCELTEEEKAAAAKKAAVLFEKETQR